VPGPGDALWLTAGLGPDQANAESVMSRGGFSHLFLPAARVAREGAGWRVEPAPAPPHATSAAPVVLVVASDSDFGADLSEGSEEAAAGAIEVGIHRALAQRSAFGRVEGIHLDLPFSPASSEKFGKFASSLKRRIPADLFLTCSLRFAPGEEEREALVRRLAEIDGFAAFVFGVGEDAAATPIATDALGKPWWACYAPGARGDWQDASGAHRATLVEKHLMALTNDPGVAMDNDLALHVDGVSGFLFRPTSAVDAAGAQLREGDRVSFQVPLVSELLYRFGADLVGRHLVRGRLIVLDGASDSERVFTLAALSDVLLGRPVVPDLHVEVTPEASSVRVRAENLSVHASVVSRTTNWVEVEVASGNIRDVQVGGFDRYEVFDPEGHPVTPGRATRVRFYETLISPREKIADGSILLRAKPPLDCCRFRQHLIAASGTEVAADWNAPPPRPTPTAAPKPKPRLKHVR